MKNDSWIERIVLVENSVIHHPQYADALNAIDNIFRMRNSHGITRHLFCVGQSGTGKTTIKKELLAKYPEVTLNDRVLKPILCGNAPAKPSNRTMAEELLKGLGDSNYHRGNTTQKTNKAIQLLEQLGVKLVILDELQHFLDHGNKRSANEVADWLKTLIDNSTASFVLIGLERAEKILQVNEQLRRRFSQRVTLLPLSINTDAEASILAAILRQIDKQLALPSRLNITPDLVKRFHFATNGIMDYVVKLMVRAFEIVSKEESGTQINVNNLAEAFRQSIWSDCPVTLNPFEKSFKWARLDKAGMPFFRHAELSDVYISNP
jgi:Cdc6-like AAA superfamily ATPase